MKAVMYGAGNIGRGFIGMLFSASGCEVIFVDVAEKVVKELQEKKQYPLRYVASQGHQDMMIKPVTAINGNDMEMAANAIAECDIMATAVGPRILKLIAPNLAEGIRRLAIGAAAGVRRYIDETASMQQNIVCAEDVLRNVSELEIGSRLSKLILDMYQMMLEGRGLGELRRAADGIKAACSENVV